ncbi:hypothetical protein [Trebonia sp.]|uniref:hypothetical protein n=1 Tax=Trebonia sp. TaxID=2767075 RepID=UPI002613E345|nr:hypothetical protein [Trebonia sp.]
MLAAKGVLAWQRTVAGLAPAAPASRLAGPPVPVPSPALAAALVSALASLAMPAP